jgi:hypothetical protein
LASDNMTPPSAKRAKANKIKPLAARQKFNPKTTGAAPRRVPTSGAGFRYRIVNSEFYRF